MSYWNDEDFVEAVKSNTTVTGVLNQFNIRMNQAHQNRKFWNDVDRLHLDTSHFKRPSPKNKLDIKQFLTKDSSWKSGTTNLKKRLIKDGLIKNQCLICGQEPFWNGKELKLQLDHINGDNTDNRIENLRILCPNCHTQTETFSIGLRKPIKNKCSICGIEHPTKSQLCKQCFGSRKRQTKINWPTKDELQNMLKTTSFSQIGRILGVSDNAVRKRLNSSR
jgi:hypothetical protein